MAAATGSPGGFALSLFSAQNVLPGRSLGVLTGSVNPVSAGVYSFDASALNFTLAPSTEYFLVESSTSSSSQGSYEWGIVLGYPGGTVGWQTADPALSSDQGNDWSLGSRSTHQIGVYATAVPELSVLTMLSLAGTAIGLTAGRIPRGASSCSSGNSYFVIAGRGRGL